MNDEMKLKKQMELSIEMGVGIWKPWNPKNHYYLYQDFFGVSSEFFFELKDNLLNVYLEQCLKGHIAILTFDKKDVLKFVITTESVRWGEFGIGLSTLKNKNNKTILYKVEQSDFQKYYQKNYKYELKNRDINYLISGSWDDVLDIVYLNEPTVNFDTFNPMKIDENEQFTDDEDEYEYIGEKHNFEDLYLPFDNYKLEKFGTEGAYYIFVLYGEKTNKRYKIEIYSGYMYSVMFNSIKYFNEDISENVNEEKGIRVFYEIKDSEYFKWYQKQNVFDMGFNVRHIRFNIYNDFVIDFIFDYCNIGVMEI